MKTSLYFHYTSRSLLRGGQRTILAVFCVTVGVMAVVALQLVGFMLQKSLSSNAREANGGDIAVVAQGVPLKTNDLAFFQRLQKQGSITGYSAIINVNGTLSNGSSITHAFSLEAVDPNNFPLVSQPTFVKPQDGAVSEILNNNQVIVTQRFLNTYHKQSGDTFPVYVRTQQGLGETLSVKIAGVIENSGPFAQSGNLLLISSHDYLAAAPPALASYTLIDVATADQAHTDSALKAITNQFPFVTTLTATDLLKAQQSSIDLITKFLEIAGLVALLIGGVGIVNTMQVLLSRRKAEIAMLKTAGYRRKDLYLLFGLEAGLLGLIGGIVGATASIGVSYLIRTLLQDLGSNIPFVLSPSLILGGVLVGCVTALIFGLLPIVQAANIRPLQVIRELENKSASGRVMTILLLGLFSILFCLLAIVILNNNIMLGVFVTYGTFAFLLLLSGIFSLIVFLVSKLPVPEHMRWTQFLLVIPGLALSALVYRYVPVFGILLFIISLLGIVIVYLPRGWKVNLKMALRNLGRRRARTVATLLALFIGVYGIGLDIGIGQDLGTLITNALNQNSPYNLVATTVGKDTTTLQKHLNSISGLNANRTDAFAVTLPTAIDGHPSQDVLPKGDAGQQGLSLLGGLEGYDLTHTVPAQTIVHGRNLNASDVNTNNVLISMVMTSNGWMGMNLKVGDTVTLSSFDHKMQKTVTIVGIISIPTSFETLGEVLAPDTLVNAFSSDATTKTSVTYMKVASAKVDQAQSEINHIVPNASLQNLSDAGTAFLQRVTSFLDVVIAIASLSMLAAIVIIANSVALAMLERRRELGILKAVGYTSRTILSQVMIENGIAGGIGAFIATLLAAGGVALGSTFFFNGNLTLNMEPLVTLSLVIVPTLLALFVAALVAWNAVRIRPLMVLRYE